MAKRRLDYFNFFDNMVIVKGKLKQKIHEIKAQSYDIADSYYVMNSNKKYRNMVFWSVFVLASSNMVTAYAGQQSGDQFQNAFDNVSKAICDIAAFLQGPIGIGLVIVMLIIGGISMAIGGKSAISTLIAALVGAIIIVGARSLAGMVAGSIGNTTCDQLSSPDGGFVPPNTSPGGQ